MLNNKYYPEFEKNTQEKWIFPTRQTVMLWVEDWRSGMLDSQPPVFDKRLKNQLFLQMPPISTFLFLVVFTCNWLILE